MSQQPQPQDSNLASSSVAAPASAPAAPPEASLPDQTQTTTQKRPAEELAVCGDSIADLIRKAKASRTSAGGLGTDKRLVEDTAGQIADTPMDDSLESALTCPICADYLYRPVAAISCLHTFCGSCLVPWLKRSSRCPSCRTRVTVVKDDHRTGSLLDMYLKLHPDKARSDEEKQTLDKTYKSGGIAKVTRGEEEDESDDEYVENDEYDEEEDPVDWREMARMQPCLCCNPPDPNPYGFACEHPIPPAPASMDGEQYRAGISRHTRCRACQATMPIRDHMSCECCALNWCGGLFQCPSPAHLQKFSEIMPDIHFYGSWATRFNTFGANLIEKRIHETWVADRGFQQSDIVNRLKEWLLENSVPGQPIPGVHVPNLSNDTLLCKDCFINTMRLTFMDWWIYEKEACGVDTRNKCWYGTECRTQRHNMDHAERLNHACHAVPPAGRLVHNPGRLPVALPAFVAPGAPPPWQVPNFGAAGPAQPAPPSPPPPAIAAPAQPAPPSLPPPAIAAPAQPAPPSLPPPAIAAPAQPAPPSPPAIAAPLALPADAPAPPSRTPSPPPPAQVNSNAGAASPASPPAPATQTPNNDSPAANEI